MLGLLAAPLYPALLTNSCYRNAHEDSVVPALTPGHRGPQHPICLPGETSWLPLAAHWERECGLRVAADTAFTPATMTGHTKSLKCVVLLGPHCYALQEAAAGIYPHFTGEEGEAQRAQRPF